MTKNRDMPARDMIAEALIRLRFLSELTTAWDVQQAGMSEEALAGIGTVIDEVIAQITRVDRLLAEDTGGTIPAGPLRD